MKYDAVHILLADDVSGTARVEEKPVLYVCRCNTCIDRNDVIAVPGKLGLLLGTVPFEIINSSGNDQIDERSPSGNRP